jgi:prepilin signal peptidase PulO-like enzyme (type II secretory pathway)
MVYLNVGLGILFFAAAVFVGIWSARRLYGSLAPLSDGPVPGTPPVRWMYGIAVATGAVVGLHAGAPEPAALLALSLGALLSGCFMAIWYCDTCSGIVPDCFTLPPLALVFLFGLIDRNVLIFVTAAALFLPFAYSAYRSKGLGMGWGDAKLVALGGAALGIPAFLSVIGASLAMAIHAKLTKRMHEPIAFAPYLIVGFECSLASVAWLR